MVYVISYSAPLTQAPERIPLYKNITDSLVFDASLVTGADDTPECQSGSIFSGTSPTSNITDLGTLSNQRAEARIISRDSSALPSYEPVTPHRTLHHLTVSLLVTMMYRMKRRMKTTMRTTTMTMTDNTAGREYIMLRKLLLREMRHRRFLYLSFTFCPEQQANVQSVPLLQQRLTIEF